jgi:hypothetical protein
MTGLLAAAVGLGVMLLPLTGAAQSYDAPPDAANATQAEQVEALQERVQAQPETMEAIRKLQDDPAFQDVINDPDIAAALRSGDMAALLANSPLKKSASRSEL